MDFFNKDISDQIDIDNDRPYWVAFNCFQGVGPKRFVGIIDYFGSAKQAWEASDKDWQEVNLPGDLLSRLSQFRQEFHPQDFYSQVIEGSYQQREKWLLSSRRQANWQWVKKGSGYRLTKTGPIKVMTWLDEGYPAWLREIDRPPPVLYLRGEDLAERLTFFRLPALAVVGTRRLTSYGRTAIAQIVPALARAGLVIVSGMARGADSRAHRAALEENGRTIAVLGTGVDVVYPRDSRLVYRDIVDCGLVVSEFPPGFPPLPGNFPARNRIISGLTQAVLVVEGDIKSGSLITARCAAQQGREVMAVPGSIRAPLSAGPLHLIKNGAKPITASEDVLEEFNLETEEMAKKRGHDESGELLDLLKQQEATVDEICRQLDWSISRANGRLTELEIKGIVKRMGGGKWARVQ